MAQKNINKIFLSASVPDPERDRKFYDTADIIAIRDAVRALATVVIPKAQLIWGGHPAITPLIRFVMDKMKSDIKQHVTLYQSKFFEEFFPEDNFEFENIVLTSALNTRDESLMKMRQEMITDNNFTAGIFIGGMEGVIDEYRMYNQAHPRSLILPIASTGGAAKLIYEESNMAQDERLLNDYAYMGLFRDLLSDFL